MMITVPHHRIIMHHTVVADCVDVTSTLLTKTLEANADHTWSWCPRIWEQTTCHVDRRLSCINNTTPLVTANVGGASGRPTVLDWLLMNNAPNVGGAWSTIGFQLTIKTKLSFVRKYFYVNIKQHFAWVNSLTKSKTENLMSSLQDNH